MTDNQSQWMGRALTYPEIVVIIATSALAIVVPISLQPLLLGGMVAENRLTLTELGQTATAELIAMAITCALASAYFKPTGVRLKGVIAGLGLIAANALTMISSHEEVLLARGVSGASFGIYMWIAICMLVRTHNAARISGIITATQAIVSVILSYAFATFVVARFGINGGYACLAGMSLLMVLASGLFPPSFDPLPSGHANRMPPARGIAGLLVIFLFLAGVIGVWAYFGAMSQQSGHAAEDTGLAVSVALVGQVVGALLASTLGHRIKPLIATIVGGLGCFGLAVAVASGLPIVAFAIAGALYGMLWMFSTPLLIPLIMEIDPTRTSAMYSLTVQMLGAASGPAFGAMLIHGSDVRPAIIGAGVLLIVAVTVAVAIQMVRVPRSATP
jgi:MFS transporter, DHA1 family, inner membrane transport protein